MIWSFNSISSAKPFLSFLVHVHHFISGVLQWLCVEISNSIFALCFYPLHLLGCHGILGIWIRKFLNDAHCFRGTQSRYSEHTWFRYQGHSHMEEFIMWSAIFHIAIPMKPSWLTFFLSQTNLQHRLYHLSQILPKIHGLKESTTYRWQKHSGLWELSPISSQTSSVLSHDAASSPRWLCGLHLPVTSEHFMEAMLSSYFLCLSNFWLLVLHFDSRFRLSVSRKPCHLLRPVQLCCYQHIFLCLVIN